MLSLEVNGERRSFEEDGLTVSALLGALGVDAPAIAVEVNRQIVPRGEHAEHVLHDGDRVEIVTFVGGG